MKKLILPILCGTLAAAHGWADVTVFPVVPTYDDTNKADLNAEYYAGNSSGVGEDPSLIIDIAKFRDEIVTAFSNAQGGVVNFDNGLIAGGTQSDQFVASFGEDKRLVITSVDHLRTDFSANNILTPISGPDEGVGGGFLSKSVVDGDQIKIRSSFDFSFEEKNFGGNEHVIAVAGTILGRNGAADSSTWLMKVRLDNGDIIAEISQINFLSGNARADTFFGARAPKGRYITGVTWINLDGNHSGLDGFAFITNGRPPIIEEDVAVNPGETYPGLDYPGTGSGGGSGGDEGSTDASILFGRERP